jgi:hypothetical protein
LLAQVVKNFKYILTVKELLCKNQYLLFGVLASSLVMLAVMPMLSNNDSFSNTAAKSLKKK